LAVQQGADGVEFDVQLSKDGALVVIHDERLERTTGGSGWVKDHTLAQLQRLDASGGKRGFHAYIPTLAEVLAILTPTDLRINVELKTSVVDYPGIEEKVLEQIEIYALEPRIVLSSFNHYSLRRLMKLGTTCEIATLFTDPIYKPWAYAAEFGAAAFHPWVGHVRSKAFVSKSHAAGVAVRPWIVNSKKDLRRMFKWEVDAVFTDVPDIARSILPVRTS
jgi:glycerophosphoryl diester phosphodiesterase